MRYMIVINTNAAAEAAYVGAERDALYASHDAVIAELVEHGEFVDSNELDPENVTVVGTHQGKPVATRGPFTEGTEFIGGYYIVDVSSHERAVEIAGRFVEGRFSPIEVRRLMHETESVRDSDALRETEGA